MREPVVETVLLLLLVVFFGIQQRERPQLYFRVWMVGWIFFFASLALWDAKLSSAPSGVMVALSLMRYDLIVVGGLAFALSTTLTRERLRLVTLQVTALVLPTLFGVDLLQLPDGPPHLLLWLPTALVVGSEVGAVALVVFSMRSTRSVRRIVILTICTVFCVWIAETMLRNPRADISDLILAQIFLCAATHYWASYGRTRSGQLGAVGFALWGAFYAMPEGGSHALWARHVMYMFWNAPKYLVGFSMALHVLESDGEEKAQLVEQLRVLYSDFKGLYESHPHPVWIHDLEGERFLSTNAAAQAAYGLTAEEFLAHRPGALESAWDEEADEMDWLLPPPPEGRHARHRAKNGELVWMNLVERPIVFQGREARMVLARDITSGLRTNRELALRAHHDPLTGLPNRLLLEERLPQCLAMCSRDGLRAAVLAIDLDHFKRVNDTHGHMVGDACLKAVAARMAGRMRQMDIIARTGGEEFVAVIGRLQSVEDARKVAVSLLRQFDDALQLEECELPLTISIGVAVYPEDGLSAVELRKRADEALYEAKHRGRACVVLAREMAVVR